MTARVTAVLTVHNRREHTLACLRSLAAQKNLANGLSVVLVDDASTDGTGAAVRREFPDVTVLDGDGSLFWGGGMHRALAEAVRVGADHYLWINDDVELDADAVERLLATHGEVTEGGVAPTIVVGSMRDPETGATTYGGVHRPDRTRPMSFVLVEPGARPVPVETMNGNCVLVPADVVARVGNIDPVFTQKMGDFDYGLRARAAGCRIVAAPGTHGACATHPPRATRHAPLGAEIRRLWSTKELPPRAWATFTRRWAGTWWPLYFASPYVQRTAQLVRERVAAPREAEPTVGRR